MTIPDPSARPPSFVWVRWLFLRALGVTSFVAFVSLWAQADGLLGSRGIMPAAESLAHLRALAADRGMSPWALYHHAPTALWLGASDTAIHTCCALGVLASLALAANVAPLASIALAWATYLSLSVGGTVFFHYQWDALLLESFVVAALVAPWGLRPGLAASRMPSRAAWVVVRALVFKLMFLSGVVKLTSGDPTWRDLTALSYHFLTQPIPNALSVWAWRLPGSILRVMTALMFVVELVAPLLVFGPRKARAVAFVCFVALMAGIALTGNYGFFNLLACALSVPLLDDDLVRRRLPASVRALMPEVTAAETDRPSRVRRAVHLGAVAVIAALSLARLTASVFRDAPIPRPAVAMLDAVEPFRSVNGYGLFAVMTTDRPEIVLEASDDGVRWEPLHFRWKPTDVHVGARSAGLHMPRLDWQLWFASLAGHCQRARWYPRFVERILDGSRPVRDLMGDDAFRGHPPRYVRSTLYDYRFSARPGTYWERTPRGAFCPTLTRENGRLMTVEGL